MGSRGPAPKPDALRRSRDADLWTRLPPHGLTSEHDVPTWPEEAASPSMAEQALWTRLWRTKPAAWAWLRHDLADQVAIYVRFYLRTQQDPSAAEVNGLLRLTATLMLDPVSLQRARYTVDHAVDGPLDGLDAPEKAPAEPGTVTPIRSTRDRMGGA